MNICLSSIALTSTVGSFFVFLSLFFNTVAQGHDNRGHKTAGNLKNQISVEGNCIDYLVDSHLLYSVKVTDESKTVDQLNKVLAKNFEKLLWRLKRSRVKNLTYKIVQDHVEQTGSGVKGSKAVDIYIPKGQKFSDIDKIIEKTRRATLFKAQSILTDSSKNKAINKCIQKATKEAKLKALQVTKSLQIKIQKKPLHIIVDEKIGEYESTALNGDTLLKKKLTVYVKIGFKIK